MMSAQLQQWLQASFRGMFKELSGLLVRQCLLQLPDEDGTGRGDCQGILAAPSADHAGVCCVYYGILTSTWFPKAGVLFET